MKLFAAAAATLAFAGVTSATSIKSDDANLVAAAPIVDETCASGSVRLGTHCVPCQPGSFATDDGCIACPHGTVSTASATQCTALNGDCPYGSASGLTFPGDNGKCRVVANPLIGSVFQIQQRQCPPSYIDGTDTMDPTLPSARTVSNALCAQDRETGNAKKANLLLIFFGQFLDHDMTLIGEAEEGADDANIILEDGSETPFHRASFTRLKVGGSREYTTLNTAWIDLTNVYGDTIERATSLRTLKDGLLKSSRVKGQEFLPFESQVAADKDLKICGSQCRRMPEQFMCGDIRCNENPVLLSIHTLFLREHNRLAAAYSALHHGTKTDEEIYEAARLINIRQYQKILWEEYLPILVGQDNIDTFAGDYKLDESVDPTCGLHFSTAAYRYGHSGIKEVMPQAKKNGLIKRNTQLADAFFRPELITKGRNVMARFLNGARAVEHETLDLKIVDAIRQHLFGALDLAALNMQRGRDVGLASVNVFRETLDLPAHADFMAMTGDKEVAATMETLYGSVERVDLWIAGMSEPNFGTSQLGETFTKSLIEQFNRMRSADRFWYENVASADDFMLGLADMETGISGLITRNFKGVSDAGFIARPFEGKRGKRKNFSNKFHFNQKGKFQFSKPNNDNAEYVEAEADTE